MLFVSRLGKFKPFLFYHLIVLIKSEINQVFRVLLLPIRPKKLQFFGKAGGGRRDEEEPRPWRLRSICHTQTLSLTHTHLLQGLPGSCLQVVKFPLVLIRVARSVSSNQRRAIKETDNREIINSSVLRIKLKGKLAHNHYHHAADCRTSCTNLSQSQLYSHTLYLSL